MVAQSLAQRTDAEIATWIANHERAGRTDAPLYRELLEERVRRSQEGGGLDFSKSLQHLKRTAVAQACTSYGALASASGVAWSKARHRLNGPNGHLDRLVDICHARGLPMLTAICVNQENLAACELGGESLAGFVAAARRLGMQVGDAVEFHHRRRAECWEWGASQPGGS